jgi:hypothetical protein
MPSSRQRAAISSWHLPTTSFAGSGSLRPDLVLIERVFLPHLVFEIGEQLGGTLFGRAFHNLLALADEPLQVLAL